MMEEYRIWHDCASPECRQPLGAVKTSGQVCLRLKTLGAELAWAELILFSDRDEKTVRMTVENGVLEARFSVPSEAGVLFYYFRLADGRFLGADAAKRSTAGVLSQSKPAAFQITVCEADFETPAWFRKSVMYQIFPDRFAKGDEKSIRQGLEYHRKMGRTVRYHESWDERVSWQPAEGEPHYEPCDYFGGTLRAIEAELPRIAALGVGVIYLNPVFEAASNHRYNTADYMKIDPLLGTEEDFSRLAEKAEALGIRIILDGVFSHTGADSVYFNRRENYPQKGAYQSRDSRYFGWYDFRAFPENYRCWWGFKSLPEVNEENQEWQEYVISGGDSVIKHWLRAGARGYRLDVADELPDDVLRAIRKVVKAQDMQAVVLGEVWEDATTKCSYGKRREYALGGELDSVMNYPLRSEIIDFALGVSDARRLAAFLKLQRLNYPLPMYYSLMSLLSSHDVERIRSVLASGLRGEALTRAQQASFVISAQQDERGAALQRVCAAIVFAVPGVPAVYYGDELGMHGFLDPFNRAPLARGEYSLEDFYKSLALLRKNNDALSVGAVGFFAPHADVLCVLRFTENGRDVFGESAENGCFLAVVNRGKSRVRFALDLLADNSGLDARQLQSRELLQKTRAECLLSGVRASVKAGVFIGEAEPLGVNFYKLD